MYTLFPFSKAWTFKSIIKKHLSFHPLAGDYVYRLASSLSTPPQPPPCYFMIQTDSTSTSTTIFIAHPRRLHNHRKNLIKKGYQKIFNVLNVLHQAMNNLEVIRWPGKCNIGVYSTNTKLELLQGTLPPHTMQHHHYSIIPIRAWVEQEQGSCWDEHKSCQNFVT